MAAAVVVALVLGGIFLVPQLLQGTTELSAAQTPDPRPDAVVVTPTPTPEESAEPEPEPEPSAAALPPLEFKSNSGNIRCRITQDAAICRQGEIQYPTPSQNCSPLSGTTIGVDAGGAYWPCLKSDFLPASILGYDTPASRYGFTCAINYTRGVTCTNEFGSGFTMEYRAGVSTF